MTMLAKATELRDQALRDLAQTPAWQLVKAADDMIEALGGKRVLPNVGGMRMRVWGGEVLHTTPKTQGRFSQADVAEQVIAEANRPIPVVQLVAKLEEKGMLVGGERKEINLSSALSRDSRFESVRVDGVAMWTLKSLAAPTEVQPRRAMPLDDDL